MLEDGTDLVEEFLASAPAADLELGKDAQDLAAFLTVVLELEDPTALRMADLAPRAGGFDALAELETAPLPAEELAPAQIPEDLRVLAAEIDTHLVDGVTALLSAQPAVADVDELLTACQRLLVRITQLDPAVLRWKASTRNIAAAVVSLIARGNDLMGYSPALLHEKELRRTFELRSSPTQRARTLKEAAAFPHRFDGIALADPGLLLGTARAELLRVRDALASQRSANHRRAARRGSFSGSRGLLGASARMWSMVVRSARRLREQRDQRG